MRLAGWAFWIAAMALVFSASQGHADNIIGHYGLTLYSLVVLMCLIAASALFVLGSKHNP